MVYWLIDRSNKRAELTQDQHINVTLTAKMN